MNDAQYDCVKARAKLLGDKLIEIASAFALEVYLTRTEIEGRCNGNAWVKLTFDGGPVLGPDVETAASSLRAACDVLSTTGPMFFEHVSWRRDDCGRLSLREAGFGLRFAALVSMWPDAPSFVENGWTLHADGTLTCDATA